MNLKGNFLLKTFIFLENAMAIGTIFIFWKTHILEVYLPRLFTIW